MGVAPVVPGALARIFDLFHTIPQRSPSVLLTALMDGRDTERHGPVFRVFGSQCGGTLPRGRYPFARIRYICCRFGPLYFPGAKLCAARANQAFSLGNPVSIYCPSGRKT